MNSGENFLFFRYTRMTMQLFGKYQDWKFGLLEKLISIISCNFLMINNQILFVQISEITIGSYLVYSILAAILYLV